MQSQFYEKFGKYIFLEKLGSGGMAEVYLAMAPGAQGVSKLFAIKRILSKFSVAHDFVDLFKEEAKIAIQLHHNNIVSVLDFGFESDQFFLVMEFVHGKNLSSYLKNLKKKNKKIPIPLVLFLIRELAQGLDYAHTAKDVTTGESLHMIHRDVSPQNVMISYSGDVKLIDFGVAKVSNQDAKIKTGKLVGKISYMSPEMIEGQAIDHRSDLFSLGVIFWELLAGGQRLFTGDSESAILESIKQCQIPSLSKIDSEIHVDIESIVNRCLSARLDRRYQSAENLVQDINRFFNKMYPDFSKKQVEEFFTAVADQTYKDSVIRMRNYYNLHFEEILADAAIGVPKNQIQNRSQAHSSLDDEPTEYITQGADSTNSQLTQRRDKSHISHLTNRSYSQSLSRQDIYLTAQHTQEDLKKESTAIRWLYMALSLIIFSVIFYQLVGKKAMLRDLKPISQIEKSYSEFVIFEDVKMFESRDALSCFLLDSGQMTCGGKNDFSQMGLGQKSKIESLRDLNFDFSIIDFSLGYYHVCAVAQLSQETGNTFPLKCWGDNTYSQVGDPTSKQSLIPVTVDAGVDYKEVAVGVYHSCGLTIGGDLKCWGLGKFGQLGDLRILSSPKPIQIPIGQSLEKIVSGAYHVCALNQEHKALCWGRNDVGQLGQGSFSEKADPQWVQSESRFKSISAGEFHTCGLTELGGVECWGKNEFGQLGVGSNEPSSQPKALKIIGPQFVDLKASRFHTCARDSENQLWCWGRNDSRQISKKSIPFFREPTLIEEAQGLHFFAMGDDFSCWKKNNKFSCYGVFKFQGPTLSKLLKPDSDSRKPAESQSH